MKSLPFLLLASALALPALAQDGPAIEPTTVNPAAVSGTVAPGILPESMRQALANVYNTNPQIKAQRKVVEQRDEAVNQAFAGWLPRASAGYDRGRQRSRYNQPDFQHGDTQILNGQVQQPIFNGGETIALTSRENHQVLAARADLVSIEQQMLQRGITAYMDVVRDRAILDLSRANVDVLRKQMQASHDRFDVGEVTRTDVAQSEARLSRATTDAIQAEGNLAIAISNFERVVGYTPETLAVPENFPELPAKLEDALAISDKSNPNLTGADYRTLAGQDDIDVSESNLLPDVTLQGSTSRQEGAGVFTRDDYDVDAVTLNVSISLYQSGAEYSRVRAAKSRASELKYQAINARDATREATIQAWKQLETSISTIQSTSDAIRAAEIALSGVTEEQLYGARTVLDVLDAEQELFAARVGLVRAKRDRIVAIFGLLSQLGQLTPSILALNTPAYDPKEHYDNVRYRIVGF